MIKSFATLEGLDVVDPDDLVTTMRDYAKGGAGISDVVVNSIIARTPLTGEQIAEALLEYHKLGITAFLIRGFDPIQDALAYGREILPRVREAVAQRDEAFGVVTAEVA